MTIFRSGEVPPAWCELRAFDTIELTQGELISQKRRQPRERLIVARGTIQLRMPDSAVILKEAQFFDIPDLEGWQLRGCSASAELVRLSGRWGSELGGCGLFRVANQEKPVNIGEPVDYPKTTSIDRHYHDCDEFWVVLEGGGTVRVGGRAYEVGAGDCVGLGFGHSHDFPIVREPVKAVFFETTLEGAKRIGHLWAHTHGPARPSPERV